QALIALDAAGTPHVLVTVASSRGSAPREAGAKMVVTADQLHDSIGGGNLEHKACAMARRMLAEGVNNPTLEHFPLGPALGQCCGGQVALLLEPFRANHFHVVLFGAGHVGRAVAKALAELPCRVTWIDSRDGVFPKSLPDNVVAQMSDAPAYDVGEAPDRAYFLIMTHSHAIDRDVTEAVLRRGHFAYCGLIGSRSKRRQFEKRWRAKGLAEAQIGRLTCPIGIEGISGKRPAEIAVAVAAQLLLLHHAPQTAAETLESGPADAIRQSP
ncbi:MAG: xanthine dehydrogenase accessory protein XdhC, partial [bacterium]|nr:xanthine dehydrogenase accessory protein XdhC [bacterium]